MSYIEILVNPGLILKRPKVKAGIGGPGNFLCVALKSTGHQDIQDIVPDLEGIENDGPGIFNKKLYKTS